MINDDVLLLGQSFQSQPRSHEVGSGEKVRGLGIALMFRNP